MSVDVSLALVHPALTLFAEGLADRPIRLEAAPSEQRGWPFDPPRAGAPDVIRLPAVSRSFRDPVSNRLALRAQVLHHLGLWSFADETTHARDFVARHPELLGTPDGRRVERLFTQLESVRVVADLSRRFPGSTRDLRALSAAAGAEVVASGRSADPVVAAVRLRALGASRPLIAAATGLTERGVEQITRAIEPLADPAKTSTDAAQITLALLDIDVGTGWSEPDEAPLGRPETEPEPASLETLDPDGEHHDDPQGAVDFEVMDLDPTELAPEELAAFFGSLPGAGATLVDVDGSDDTLPGSLADEVPSFERDDGSDAEELRPASDDSVRRWSMPALDLDGRSFVYDEWDHRQQAYRPAWCRVVEERLAGGDPGFINDVRDEHAALAHRVRRQFLQLRPQSHVRVHRLRDGDELDLDALVEAVVDRRTTGVPDDRVHVRRERAARDVATAFLVDLSASTSAPAEEPPPVEPIDEPDFIMYPAGPMEPEMGAAEDVRRVIDIAKESVALMCDALDQLGDGHAVYGFSGNGRHNVEFQVAKDFGQRTSSTTWSSLAAMKPLSYTRMGPAIRHATTKLAAEDARTKLLMVISDGYPQDVDYGPDRGDREYGIHDTATALAEAAHLGVDTFCVTIDPAGHDYLRLMFPDERYLVIDEVSQLPEELAKVYLALTVPS